MENNKDILNDNRLMKNPLYKISDECILLSTKQNIPDGVGETFHYDNIKTSAKTEWLINGEKYTLIYFSKGVVSYGESILEVCDYEIPKGIPEKYAEFMEMLTKDYSTCLYDISNEDIKKYYYDVYVFD
jgi:hypothetical protein